MLLKLIVAILASLFYFDAKEGSVSWRLRVTGFKTTQKTTQKTTTRGQILEVLRSEPKITRDELARMLGKSHVFMTGLEAGLLALVVLMMVGYAHAGMWGRGMLILAVLLIWTSFFVYCEVRFHCRGM